jgi:hypothetical protein
MHLNLLEGPRRHEQRPSRRQHLHGDHAPRAGQGRRRRDPALTGRRVACAFAWLRSSDGAHQTPAANEQRERRSRPPLSDERRSLGASPALVARCSLGRGGAVAASGGAVYARSPTRHRRRFLFRSACSATPAVVDRAGLAELSVSTIAAGWNATSCGAVVQQEPTGGRDVLSPGQPTTDARPERKPSRPRGDEAVAAGHDSRRSPERNSPDRSWDRCERDRTCTATLGRRSHDGAHNRRREAHRGADSRA